MIRILLLFPFLFIGCGNNNTKDNYVQENDEIKKEEVLLHSKKTKERLFLNPKNDSIQIQYTNPVFNDSVHDIVIWNTVNILFGKKKMLIEDNAMVTDYGHIGWSDASDIFIYKSYIGDLDKNIYREINNPYASVHSFYDIEFNTSNYLLFTNNLNCYLAQNDRIRCFEGDDSESTGELVSLKELIFNDVEKMISTRKPISKLRCKRYYTIYNDFNFQSSTYTILFKYLFDLTAKYSNLPPKYNLNKSAFPSIYKINNLILEEERKAKIYNDFAFYLEQSKAYKEAIFVLEKIITKFPERTVAYINLGDAYWGLADQENAKKAYSTYVTQMKTKRKTHKIPKRVTERLAN